MKLPTDEGFMTTEEVLEYLQVNLPTVYRLIREVRRISARLPIIVITGFSTEASAIEAVNLGVTGYLVKPFHASEVLADAARAIGVPAA